MVDFGAMLAGAVQSAPIEPRELHSLLKKRPGFGYLRDVQGQVLAKWHERRDERDLVIKVNTGGGKTIDGLLILQSYLNEGISPALYVAPSKYLVAQVIAEAENLGIATTQNVDGAQYLNGEAIGVINAYELVNGRTKFSKRRTSRSRAPIGSVVIDDAHAAISTTRQQLSLTLPRNNAAFDQLRQLFADELKAQSPDAFLDVVDDRRGPPVRVPFWAWRSKIDQAREILRTQSDSGGPLFFSWPGVSDVLLLSRLVFNNRELTVTPHCPPIDHVTSFNEAKRRVFLTATLADDSVLVTDFGADPGTVARPITPASAGDIGERMILAPQEINPAITASEVREAIVDLSASYNTVVLVPSEKWAEVWAPDAAAVAIGDDVEGVVDRLRNDDHVGLVVLVNRYDGIDLPDNACRILVVDGLPEAFSPEERLASLLRTESGIDERQVQRIEQGMGRGVRSNEDHCVVFLLGPRLAQLTVDPRTLQQFSPATAAQLSLSRQVAAQMDNLPLERILATARQALERDTDWVSLALQSLRHIPPKPGNVGASAMAQREAFVAAVAGDYGRASEILQEAIDDEPDEARAGVLIELQASYRDNADPELAQQLLGVARGLNSYVTRPLTAPKYTRLNLVLPQAVKSAERLASRFTTPVSLRLEFEALIEDLQFDEYRTEEFEEAMRRLASLLGLGSQRPEHQGSLGPDNLWALGNNQYWVIEAKTGAKSPAIGKRDMAQLAESLLWFGKHYDPDAAAVPVMVHPAVECYANATPPPGMKVLTERGLGELAAAARGFATGLAEMGWGDAEVVGRLLSGHKLMAEDLPQYLVNQRGVYRKGGS